jgi:Tol biopolymer transport system component
MDLSPDGQTIVFASGRRIGTVGIDGGNIQFLHPLKGSPNYISNPAWSPDGSQIVFQAGQARVQSLFVMDSNGGRARGVLGGVGRNPSWSPNGARIAFTRCCNYRRINTIGVRGGSQVFVAMGRVRVSEVGPVWSPDGKQIAFALDGSHVGIVDASGTGRVRELPVPDVGRLAWSPDGSQIAIAQTCGGISLLDAATGGVREVLGCSDHPSLGPVWLPSGKALLVVRAAGA